MSDSLFYTLLPYGIYGSVALFVSLFCVIALGVFLTNTRVAALLFLVAIMCFVNPSYGFWYGNEPRIDIYAEGARTFFFPWIQYYLYGLFLATLFQNTYSGQTLMNGAGKRWMLAFAALFCCHVAYGFATGVSLFQLLSKGGLINVLHLSMIAYIAVSVFRDEKSIAVFTKTLLGIAVVRGCYALARFLFRGGDPQNAYANYGGFDLKITYWDVNEGLIATIVVFYCAWRLYREWSTLSLEIRIFFVGTVVVELLVILLSYRRTNWYGFLLAGVYFMWLLPKSKRAVVALAFVLLIMPPVVLLSSHRQEQSLRQSNLSLIERLAPDVGVSLGADTANTSAFGRFYELSKAIDTVFTKNALSPLFGVGAWGEFDVGISSYGLDWHKGNYGFVHSGFGHVLLKSGLIGLTIFCGMLFSAWRFASRARSYVPVKYLALFESFMAGLIFSVPGLLFGTPIVEFRTMALLGLVLAVPISIAMVARSPSAQPVGKSRPMTAHSAYRFFSS